MSTYIVGRGVIDTYGTTRKELLEVEGLMYDTAGLYNVDEDNGTIDFEVEGMNGIDYSPVDTIRDRMLAGGMKFSIVVNEYIACTDSGYDYSNIKEEHHDHK